MFWFVRPSHGRTSRQINGERSPTSFSPHTLAPLWPSTYPGLEPHSAPRPRRGLKPCDAAGRRRQSTATAHASIGINVGHIGRVTETDMLAAPGKRRGDQRISVTHSCDWALTIAISIE